MTRSGNGTAAKRSAHDARMAPLLLVSSNRAENLDLASTSVGKFLAEADRLLSNLEANRAPAGDCASTVIELLSSVLKREAGTTDLQEGLGLLFHRMGSAASPLRLFILLYLETRKFLASGAEPTAEDGPLAQRFITECRVVLSWYGERKVSLILLDEESELRHEGDAIFGWRVLHERTWGELPGFEVACGVKLRGHAKERVWLKVFLREGRKHLSGDHNWTDTAGRYLSDRTPHGKVCGVLALEVEDERVIIDDARLFIPYGALGLEVGPQTVELETVLIGADGEKLRERSDVVSIRVPSRGSSLPSIALSAQSLGFWPYDPVRGEGLTGVKSVDTPEVGQAVVADLRLSSREGEELSVRLRVLSPDGWEVEEVPERILSVHPERPVSLYKALRFPLPELKLLSEEKLSGARAEVVCEDSQGRVLFGTMVRLS